MLDTILSPGLRYVFCDRIAHNEVAECEVLDSLGVPLHPHIWRESPTNDRGIPLLKVAGDLQLTTSKLGLDYQSEASPPMPFVSVAVHARCQ